MEIGNGVDVDRIRSYNGCPNCKNTSRKRRRRLVCESRVGVNVKFTSLLYLLIFLNFVFVYSSSSSSSSSSSKAAARRVLYIPIFASKHKEEAQNTTLIGRSVESSPSKSVRRFFSEERLHGGRRYLNSTPYIVAILHILLFN